MRTPSKIKTIIIEDDPNAKEYITSILSNNFDDIDITGYADGVEESIALIHKEDPELVFMDIELRDGLSFEIFDTIKQPNFEVIFITAYDNFIQRAIDHYAFSFIMKPIASQKLIAAVERYVNLKERLFTISKYQLLSDFLGHQDTQLLLHIGKEHIAVKISDIIKYVADSNYTQFHLTNGKTLLASNSLKYYEKLLADKRFFKAHRSVNINIDHIASIYKKETIILKNNEKIHVSVRNKPNLSQLITMLS
ncbi:LytTR family DNA-binding domain-containing protein [Aquimarina sp. MMG016]|uniref:LytR/AlgR family response regulator transcription factor n=1 Tax=Aquimarina sp. MMG016 TaxID=2822690 RepID=UPI001B3A118A|nr:LytTR family DNA-binding domain-containing protein [Aquimarina sp. MMG016]MBQ4819596.1 response regulator transcription factor [Aquimarina sp. MMG016]